MFYRSRSSCEIANLAHFRFYEELNDFLPKEKRKQRIAYSFWGQPAIKDAIESIGVPHCEIDVIVVNKHSVDFNYRLRDGDYVAVYPVFESFDIQPIIRLRPSPLRKTKFIIDANLGKLARLLRLCGFDCVYEQDYDDATIVTEAQKQKCIILTRDQQLLKRKQVTHGLWIRHTRPDNQLQEVLDKLQLTSRIKLFSRCMSCNGQINSVKKDDVLAHIPPKTQIYFDTFFQCTRCEKIYWQGSHYKHMLALISKLTGESFSV